MQGKASEAFDVVILYDHFASAGRAMTAYGLLRQELESELTPAPRIWRIDVAASAEFAPKPMKTSRPPSCSYSSVRGSEALSSRVPTLVDRNRRGLRPAKKSPDCPGRSRS